MDECIDMVSMLVISFTIWYNLLKLMFGIITKESV